MNKIFTRCLLMVGAVVASHAGAADLYKATAAADKKDYAQAFGMFRELAEMGHPEAQENLAVMYVNGEGVKRDNVLGYAWATIALESGGGEAAKQIVGQLASHLTPAANARVTELQTQFGREALKKSLYPILRTPPDSAPRPPCNPTSVANPDNFYPAALRSRRITGDVVIESTVFSDGHAHDPRALQSFPPELFAVAGRNVTLHNGFKPALIDGAAVPCVIKIRIKFSLSPNVEKDPLRENIVATRERAARGDPTAQLAYAYTIENRYDEGDKKDLPMTWYLKAAQAGVPAAQYFVGLHTLTGNGVEMDEAKALYWLTKAADGGSPEADLALANYHQRKSPDPVSLVEAARHFRKAADSGNPEAAYYLAALLATSPEASLRDSARALDLIEKAKDGYGTNPIWFEIRAAANAMRGEFERAQKDQTAAVRAAGKLGWNTAPQKARLADYEAGKAWSGDLFAFY